MTNIWIAGVVPILEGFEGGDGTVVAGEPSIAIASNGNGETESEKLHCGRRQY